MNEIETIEAAGNYCCLQVMSGQLVIRETLASVLSRLGRRRILQIHKSVAVALDQISEIRPLPSRDALVVLKSGRKLRVSRAFRNRLDAAMGTPLG